MTETYVARASPALLNLVSRVEVKGNELKYCEPYGGSIGLSTTFTHFTMNGLAAGVGYDQRVGRAVKLLGVEVSGWFTPSDTSQTCRLIIENRKAGYLAVPDETYGHFEYEALVVAESAHQYYVDDYIGFPATVNATGLTYPTIPYSRFVPLNLTVRWDLAADITQNCVFVHMASDSAAATHPTFKGHIRFYFTDA
jgi:hypothetical protein